MYQCTSVRVHTRRIPRSGLATRSSDCLFAHSVPVYRPCGTVWLWARDPSTGARGEAILDGVCSDSAAVEAGTNPSNFRLQLSDFGGMRWVASVTK